MVFYFPHRRSFHGEPIHILELKYIAMDRMLQRGKKMIGRGEKHMIKERETNSTDLQMDEVDFKGFYIQRNNMDSKKGNIVCTI
jgi:hypothetical protein